MLVFILLALVPLLQQLVRICVLLAYGQLLACFHATVVMQGFGHLLSQPLHPQPAYHVRSAPTLRLVQLRAVAAMQALGLPL